MSKTGKDNDYASADTSPVLGDNDTAPPPHAPSQVGEDHTYSYTDSRKLGVTGSVFLILNKMIGTGSKFDIIENCTESLIN